ncbi:MAG: 30S ribosomal protein S1 [Verrucomicrobiae bacterium]|nr:30S ribosomal protein S1 [Verrucomicrobiae bacterium]
MPTASATAVLQELFANTIKDFAEGSIIKGRIIQIGPKEVIVDIGYKSEGVISADEFSNLDELQIGDEIEVLLVQLENNEGMVVLSKSQAEQKLNWDKIVAACNEGATVKGKVTKKVKGGLMVNIGVEAFLPGSQIDLQPPRNLDEYVGQTYEFKILKINQERKNIVLSRRELIENERSEKRRKILATLKIGDRVKGLVKNITDFGAFIDLDGLDGLLHITDMSWRRIAHPSEKLRVGDEVEVVVLDINREKERVSFGLKQKEQNPWDKIDSKYAIGAKVKGKVTNLLPYGAFVELEPGVEGLVHVSELSWTKRVARASDVLTVGQEIEAVILGIQKEEQKISLGVRQLERNPWEEAGHKYRVGSTVKGKVRNLTTFGAFVELEEGIDGMIHVNDISWTRKINHPSEILKKGDDVEAVVLEVDAQQQRISLGLKQLSTDPWSAIESRYKVGDLVTGKVSKVASFGAFIQLADDIDGLVHISQISEERVDKVKNYLKVGDDVKARVVKIDVPNRRIGLSIKAASYDMDRLKKEAETLDNLKPGEDLVALEHAFDKARTKKDE